MRSSLEPVESQVEPRAAITISWAHAKLLHELLGNGIKEFADQQVTAPSLRHPGAGDC